MRLEGLSDRARRPFRYANQLPEQVESAIVAAKKEKPHWGARKIRERLLRHLPHAIKVPAASTAPRCTGSPWTGDEGGAAEDPVPRALRYPTGSVRTISGAPTIRASSSSATNDTAIR